MKEKNYYKSIIIIIMLGIIGNYTLFYIMFEETNDNIIKELSDIGRIRMYDKNISHAMNVNGVYHHNNFYCVYTKGRSSEDISRTESHEVLHALIGQDNRSRSHFCD